MRVREVTFSQHVLKAKDVHLATNKDKLLLLLFSSKTHDEGSRPQKIKICSNTSERSGQYINRHFCPFRLIRQFLAIRAKDYSITEPFFVFRDSTPVTPTHARRVLRILLTNLGIDHRNYGMHNFRIGRTMDLIKYGYTVDEVKLMGRWKSNVIF